MPRSVPAGSESSASFPAPPTTGVRIRPHAITVTDAAVLLVEDSHLERRVIAAALREAGFEVIDVGTLAEALLEITLTPVALVLLDRHLSDGDGLDLVRAMRQGARRAHIPVVALTGATRRHDVDAAFLAGCDGFLGKPCALQTVVATAKAYLRTNARAR